MGGAEEAPELGHEVVIGLVAFGAGVFDPAAGFADALEFFFQEIQFPGEVRVGVSGGDLGAELVAALQVFGLGAFVGQGDGVEVQGVELAGGGVFATAEADQFLGAEHPARGGTQHGHDPGSAELGVADEEGFRGRIGIRKVNVLVNLAPEERSFSMVTKP